MKKPHLFHQWQFSGYAVAWRNKPFGPMTIIQKTGRQEGARLKVYTCQHCKKERTDFLTAHSPAYSS